MKNQFKLALVLFILGFTGVLSTLTAEFPLPVEALDLLNQNFSNWQLKALLLINPTIFLVLGIALGILFYKKVGLELPLIEGILFHKKLPTLYPLLIVGIGGGIFSGLLITITTLIFQPYMADEFLRISISSHPNLTVRFLYGGITEEIIVRFGIMTFIIWLTYRLINLLKPVVYWIGILISSLIFALLHLPLLFALMSDPTPAVISYVILANTLGGIVFGWLYWKRGLEMAMLAHMMTHVVLVIGQVYTP